jgi:cell division protein ZapA
MTSRQEPTTVEIYGENYNVRGEGDPAYLAELARFVDERMREIASQMSAADPMKIAILAALNIADDHFRYKRKQQKASELWMEKTEELSEKIGKSLGETSRRTQT